MLPSGKPTSILLIKEEGEKTKGAAVPADQCLDLQSALVNSLQHGVGSSILAVTSDFASLGVP